MVALPICDELRRSVGKSDWEPQFILRCRREIIKDLRLAREINALCMRLTAIVDEREVFADELDMLVGKYMLDKMAEFTKQVQNKDIPNLMKLQILGREFELKAQNVSIGCYLDYLDLQKVALVLLLLQGSSMAAFPKSFPLVFKDCLLDLFNQEIGEDLARVGEYKGVVFGLNIAMRRREECIGELKALGDSEDVIKIVRFMERLQHNDTKKRNRSLLLMRDMEVKTHEKSRPREEMLIIYEKRRNLVNELRSIRGIVVIQNAAEFVADTVRKDNV
nr:hypothetical protein [Tanacetum cinerariifolium]